MKVVGDSWDRTEVTSTPAIESFISKLVRCKEALERWNREEFPNNAKLVERLKKELAALSSGELSESKIRAIGDMTGQIDRLLELEEQFWWQRSRVNWLTAGIWLEDKKEVNDNIAQYFQLLGLIIWNQLLLSLIKEFGMR
ncbi:hypothetical protein K1719_033632 [Acacia pycnantha]|nr:hypothetical protein K1719_033632 [Acacia pycnantha]